MRNGRGRMLLVRFGAPALFLAAATTAILLVRSGLDRTAEPKPPRPGGDAAAVVSRRVSPPPAATAKATVRKRFYVIRAGDTLDAVAQRLGTTVDRLLVLNPGVRPTSLRIGEKIRTG